MRGFSGGVNAATLALQPTSSISKLHLRKAYLPEAKKE